MLLWGMGEGMEIYVPNDVPTKLLSSSQSVHIKFSVQYHHVPNASPTLFDTFQMLSPQDVPKTHHTWSHHKFKDPIFKIFSLTL